MATSRGSVCLVSNNETISVDTQVYNEHLGNVVTAMKWNNDSNELYTGDNTGRISVIVVRNFIVSYKTIKLACILSDKFLLLLWYCICFNFRVKQCFKHRVLH